MKTPIKCVNRRRVIPATHCEPPTGDFFYVQIYTKKRWSNSFIQNTLELCKRSRQGTILARVLQIQQQRAHMHLL